MVSSGVRDTSTTLRRRAVRISVSLDLRDMGNRAAVSRDIRVASWIDQLSRGVLAWRR
jgi:hypothetical protein